MKQKGICIDCGLTTAINKIINRCRMSQLKKEGSYWLPSEECNLKQHMVWRYIENKPNNDFEEIQ